MRRRRTANERGYNYAHRKRRDALLPHAYGTPCVRCGKAMLEGQELDFDHTDDRRGYLGFSHARCNRRAGGQKAHQDTPRNLKPRVMTRW